MLDTKLLMTYTFLIAVNKVIVLFFDLSPGSTTTKFVVENKKFKSDVFSTILLTFSHGKGPEKL